MTTEDDNSSDQMAQDLLAYLHEVKVHGRPISPGARKYATAVYTLAKATGSSGVFYDPHVLHDDDWAVLEDGETVSNQPTYSEGVRMAEWRSGGWKRYQEAEKARRLEAEIQSLRALIAAQDAEIQRLRGGSRGGPGRPGKSERSST